jgi:hypothetical protein
MRVPTQPPSHLPRWWLLDTLERALESLSPVPSPTGQYVNPELVCAASSRTFQKEFMKQLNLVTVGGVFSLPLKTKSLPKAKQHAESIAYRGVWVKTVFVSPNCIRFIEVADIDSPPQKVASEGTKIEPVPAPPQIHDEEQEIPNE